MISTVLVNALEEFGSQNDWLPNDVAFMGVVDLHCHNPWTTNRGQLRTNRNWSPIFGPCQLNADQGKSPMALDACHRCCSSPPPIFYVDSMSRDTKVAGYNGMISTMLVNALEEFGSQNDWLPNDVAFMGVVGVCAGILFSSWMCDRHGRKTALQLANSIYLVGTVIMCVSISHNEIVAGRIISSIGLGVLSVTPPIYIAEDLHYRNPWTTNRGQLRTNRNWSPIFGPCQLNADQGKSPMALDACHRCCSSPPPIFYVDSMSRDTKVAGYNGMISTVLVNALEEFGSQNDWLPNDVAFMGVVGKSPMALDACHRCCSSPPPIFYVDSMSRDTKVAGYNGLVHTIHPPSTSP
uniref:Major facilitator superfamily (MFS) profile domain-containing protein n=1 Tax=Fagus sylvatica TaxID=28930 RepID=A0A2N9EJW4_FAGSY